MKCCHSMSVVSLVILAELAPKFLITMKYSGAWMLVMAR